MTFQPSAEAKRNAHAKILMLSGSYAAVEALMFAAGEHRERAARAADTEMVEHWLGVVEILSEAKNKLRALT